MQSSDKGNQLDTQSPKALVDRSLKGETGAWELLIDRYIRLVYSVGVRHGLQAMEVEDMAQETFAALAQALPAISDANALPAWLMTTARRLCWRAIMHGRREQTPEIADLTESEPGMAVRPLYTTMPTMEELAAEWARQEALAAGMARLGERCRDLLTLLFLDRSEPSYDEISEAAGIPKGSIGPTRTRCLQQLRTLLEGLGFDGLP